MAKNNEQFEEILDELHENKKTYNSLKNELNDFKDLVLAKLSGNTTTQPDYQQPVQETNHVKIEYGELKDAVYDGMATYYAAYPTAAGDLTENDGRKLAQICAKEYKSSFELFFEEKEKKDKVEKEEYHKKRYAQGIDTVEQVAEWAPEYPPEVRRVMRFIGHQIIDVDEPVETAHSIMKIWGNAMTRVTNTPVTPPSLMIWLKYRWNKVKTYAHKKRRLSYYILYLLMCLAIGTLGLYQHKVMKMDETNHIWYKTVIRTRQDAERWHELDSILHKENSFYDRLYNIH